MKVRTFFGNMAHKLRSNMGKTAGVAVLAGGMMFAGQVNAATSFFENFESASQTGGGAAGAFGGGVGDSFGAYATGQNYSADDHTTALAGAGGDFYGHTIGVPSPVVADSISIGASDLAYDFDAWLAAYTSDAGSDYTLINVQFYTDEAGTAGSENGAAILLADGSVEGSSTTPSGAWNNVNWSYYTASGAVPAGSGSYRIDFGGPGNDTYADNVSFATRIPEPASLALLGLGGVALTCIRRRK